MEPLRRTLSAEVRIDSPRDGICTYIASDETLDSYHEVIKADGWRFTNFSRNAPFVDSHDYSSINKCVGKVIDFKVSGGRLTETAQWAIGIGNTLADFGWKMTQGGFLKAVSVGFYPTKMLTPSSGNDFVEQAESVGLDPADVRTIYVEQEQIELSPCIIGANPNALACARRAHVLSDADLEAFPALRRSLGKFQRRSTVFSFPTPATPVESMAKKTFIPLCRGAASETAAPLSTAVSQVLSDPEKRRAWNDVSRLVILEKGRRANHPTARAWDLTAGDFGGVIVPQQMGDVYDLLLTYGAFRTLGLRPMRGQFTKYAKITADPSSVWIVPSAGNAVIPQDGSFAGSSILPQVAICAALCDVHYGLLEDTTVDLSQLLLETFTKSLSKGLDYACFMGNGAADTTNGGMTGIFVDGAIPAVAAALGNTTVASLAREDFMNAVAAVAPAALQRPCRWWINPVFLPKLAAIKDGAVNPILRPPGENSTGEWTLVGFPVTWTSVAPATDAPGQKIAAFGEPDSYLVALREEIELDASRYSKFNTLNWQFRGYLRAFAETREATGLSTLSLSAR